MSREQILLAQAVLGVVGVCALLLLVHAIVQVSRLRREVALLRSEAMRSERPTTPQPAAEQSTVPEPTSTSSPEPEETAFLITGIAGERDALEARPVPQRIEGRLFADIVARETTVRAGGLLHGVRRALAPEVRNRIRFEMRQELKRSRRQRRSDLKAALRDLQQRRRDGARAPGDRAFDDGDVA